METQVVHIDTPYGDDTPTVPTSDHNYHRNLQSKPWRTDLKPLDVVQPEGPSFEVCFGWCRHIITYTYRHTPALH